MAYEIHDDPNSTYIHIIFSGHHHDGELPEYQEAIYASPGYKEKDQLADYRNVDRYEITSEGLQSYALTANARADVQLARPGRKIALLTPTDLEFGMARVFEVLMSDLPGNYRVFRTEQEALAWLCDGA